MHDAAMDDTDRRIVNVLQDAFPVSARPYRTAARRLGLTESELIGRLKRLLRTGVLSRFGPLYQIERAGGRYLLCAMRVPHDRVGAVAAMLDAMPEVAHNYERDHVFNLWFVLAAESPAAVDRAVDRIEDVTGLQLFAFPKQREYFLDLRLTV